MAALSDLPDEKLVEAALRGDVGSFVELCRRHYAALVAVARAILRDRHLAEDAAQEALAKACSRLPNLANPACFASWLMTICRNQAHDLARRTTRLESLGDRDVPAENPEPDADVEAVREAIAGLPPESAEVVYLRYYAEFSYERMSEMLGLSVQAVNGRLRRAKQAIREYLTRKADIGGHR
jgi:RNA polymerase sigma-70 factor (ECF subfamily)